MTSVTAQTFQFRLHPEAVHAMLKNQSGSLARALAEGIMNSLDAYGTEVHLTLHADGYSLRDNGIGFRSRAEIDAWFGTLGFPHESGNHRQFGAHGQGRAAQWSYAQTVWYTNEFMLTVDVRTKGLDYEVGEVVPREGTVILGNFYEALDANEVLQTLSELRHLLSHVAAPVFINGKLVSRDPATAKWDMETDEAYFDLHGKPSDGGGISVYNMGVFVAKIWEGSAKGVIVTKETAPLTLGLARNALSDTCPVWKKVRRDLRAWLEMKKAKAAPRQKRTLAEKQSDAARFLSGEWRASMLGNYPDLIAMVNGRPLPNLARTASTPWVFASKGDPEAQALCRIGTAYVVDREAFEEVWGKDAMPQLRKIMDETETHGYYKNQVWTYDLQPYLPSEDERFTPLKRAQLSELETQAERALAVGMRTAISALHRELGLKGQSTTIRFVDWTDRSAALVNENLLLDRKRALLSLNRGLGATTAFILTTFKAIFDKRLAPEERDAAYLTYVMNSEEPALAALRVMKIYLHQAARCGLTLPISALKFDLDSLGTEFAASEAALEEAETSPA